MSRPSGTESETAAPPAVMARSLLRTDSGRPGRTPPSDTAIIFGVRGAKGAKVMAGSTRIAEANLDGRWMAHCAASHPPMLTPIRWARSGVRAVMVSSTQAT